MTEAIKKRPRIVLVTGGAGFIGSHLVDALVAQGCHVRCLDNFISGRSENVNPRAELFVADVRNLAAIEPAFKEVDTVFHLAAIARVKLSIEDPVATHLANVVGTLNVLTAARQFHVRRVILASSSSVYGAQSQLPLREDMTPHPLSPYALQKLTAEGYAALFHQLYGIDTLSLRYFNVYGPRMPGSGAYALAIGVFLKQRREGHPLTIFGTGDQTRDFTHVRDVVRANLLAMEAPVADGRVLNIGQGRNVSINRVAELIGGERVYLPPRPGEPRDTLADYSRAKELLGWQPEVSLEEGIAEMLATQS